VSASVAIGPEKNLSRCEFQAPKGSRRFARIVFLYTVGVGALTIVRATRMESLAYHPESSAIAVAITLFDVTIALLGVIARSARLRVDEHGIRWGFSAVGFWMKRDRIGIVRQYRDALALVPRRGAAWYLSARDWAPWDRLPAVLGDAGLPTERLDRRAPLRAKLQGYGVALDLLLLLAFLMATAAVVLLE
jgi:hypothetical protein